MEIQESRPWGAFMKILVFFNILAVCVLLKALVYFFEVQVLLKAYAIQIYSASMKRYQ